MMIIYAKSYNAGELNRLRITKLYRSHILTRPTAKNISQTIVAIGIGIIEVEGIDPQKQVITLNVNIELKWCDDLLHWNSSQQLCVGRRNRSQLFFTPYEIWTPDIAAINGPGKEDKSVKYQYPVLAICTGTVRWSYQDKLVSYCELNVENFPFDRQFCSILLQSTVFDASEMKLRSLYKVVQLYNFINTEWKITHVTIEEVNLYNPHYSRNFSTIKINIELIRLSRFYVVKIILPFSIISSLGLFSFWLPTDSGEKIALTVSVLLSLTIYLQLISDYVPKTERGACVLTLYANITFIFVFISCLFNILSIFIYYHEEYFVKNQLSKQKKPSLVSTIHKSLVDLNIQRRISFRTSRTQSKLKSKTAREILYEMKYIRKSLIDLQMKENFSDFHYHSFYPKRSVQQLAVLVDRVLFFIYLTLMPLSIIILFHANHKSNLMPTTMNQLLDIRKTAIDPKPIYRGCPS